MGDIFDQLRPDSQAKGDIFDQIAAMPNAGLAPGSAAPAVDMKEIGGLGANLGRALNSGPQRFLEGLATPSLKALTSAGGYGQGGVMNQLHWTPQQKPFNLSDALSRASAANAVDPTLQDLKSLNPVAMDKLEAGDYAGGIGQTFGNLALLLSGLRLGRKPVAPETSLNAAITNGAATADTAALTQRVTPRLQETAARQGKTAADFSTPRTASAATQDIIKGAISENRSTFNSYLDPIAETPHPLPSMLPAVRSRLIEAVKDTQPELASRIESGKTTLADANAIRQTINQITEPSYSSTKNYTPGMITALKQTGTMLRDDLYSQMERQHALPPGSLSSLKMEEGNLMELEPHIQRMADRLLNESDFKAASTTLPQKVLRTYGAAVEPLKTAAQLAASPKNVAAMLQNTFRKLPEARPLSITSPMLPSNIYGGPVPPDFIKAPAALGQTSTINAAGRPIAGPSLPPPQGQFPIARSRGPLPPAPSNIPAFPGYGPATPRLVGGPQATSGRAPVYGGSIADFVREMVQDNDPALRASRSTVGAQGKLTPESLRETLDNARAVQSIPLPTTFDQALLALGKRITALQKTK